MLLKYVFPYTIKIKYFDNLMHSYKFSSNEIFRNGIFETGIPTEINPPILIIMEDAYKTVSGNTNEYHPTISPSPKRPRPMATKRVVFFIT
jgi:hypothetical protein